MIYDTLEHCERYLGQHPLLGEAFAYLKALGPQTPEGRIPLRGDDLFVIVERYTTFAPEERRYETHRDYLDVQAVLNGRETLYIEPRAELTPATEYDPQTDLVFYEGPRRSALSLTPGAFALLLPQDAHMPSCHAGDAPGRVVKAVAKIRIAAT